MTQVRAQTETQAANLALGHLGQPRIADLAQDGIRARTMRLFFGVARDATFREKWWSFAKGWETPAADPVDNIGPLKKRFPLPEYCLRVRYLDDGDGGVFDEESGEWDIEGGQVDDAGVQVEQLVLVTNIAAPLVAITRRVENVALWDPVLLLGFSYRLAGMSARKLGRSSAKAAELESLARDTIATASNIDSKESAVKKVRPTPSFLTARRGLRR